MFTLPFCNSQKPPPHVGQFSFAPAPPGPPCSVAHKPQLLPHRHSRSSTGSCPCDFLPPRLVFFLPLPPIFLSSFGVLILPGHIRGSSFMSPRPPLTPSTLLLSSVPAPGLCVTCSGAGTPTKQEPLSRTVGKGLPRHFMLFLGPTSSDYI